MIQRGKYYFLAGPGVEDEVDVAEGAGDAEAAGAAMEAAGVMETVGAAAEASGDAEAFGPMDAARAAMRTLVPVVSESDGLTITLSDSVTPLRISD
jgi:hypothetical protein